jgi:hypothetical protein
MDLHRSLRQPERDSDFFVGLAASEAVENLALANRESAILA